ncbi:MAG: hypothetical protein RBS95_08625 [Desulfobulbus sp.]|nr:hypothetical protein [Desulfobulbus sp.]
METFDAITGRRAMKRFDPDDRLSGEEVDRLLSLPLAEVVVSDRF